MLYIFNSKTEIEAKITNSTIIEFNKNVVYYLFRIIPIYYINTSKYNEKDLKTLKLID
jgi:hypothetical protein